MGVQRGFSEERVHKIAKRKSRIYSPTSSKSAENDRF